LGFVCARALAREGVSATLVARDKMALTSAAAGSPAEFAAACAFLAGAPAAFITGQSLLVDLCPITI
jgi:3-oxoacyl-[acyl-carrier protein] reductase